jgi:hypothetical protein
MDSDTELEEVLNNKIQSKIGSGIEKELAITESLAEIYKEYEQEVNQFMKELNG